MALKDILLHIDSFPEATPDAAIDEAVGFAATLGATLSALAGQVTIPLHSNRVADYLIHLSELVHEQEAASAAACQASLQRFQARAGAAGVLGQALLQKADLYLSSDRVALQVRTRDLCIVPLAGPYDGQMEVVEAVLFNAGRPVLVFRAGEASLPQKAPGTIVLAWDGSRSAARAMADALPILKLAAQVRILTVLDEKPQAVAGLGAEALRHLAAHGVAARVAEVEAAGRKIGAVLDAYLGEHEAELLVMGGYGHTRLREVILGGATEHVLNHLKTPVILSH
jgi:nucleotide-binding universal stress UspA family protein